MQNNCINFFVDILSCLTKLMCFMLFFDLVNKIRRILKIMVKTS